MMVRRPLGVRRRPLVGVANTPSPSVAENGLVARAGPDATPDEELLALEAPFPNLTGAS